MSKRLKRIEPWQTAKTLAGVYFLLGLVLAVPLGLLSSLAPAVEGQESRGIGFFLVLPFLYGLGALIFVPIACWIYNGVARRLGGIEVVVEETDGGRT